MILPEAAYRSPGPYLAVARTGRIFSRVALRSSPTRNANSVPTRISGSSSSASAETTSTQTSDPVFVTLHSSAPISGLYCASRFSQVNPLRLQYAAKMDGKKVSSMRRQSDRPSTAYLVA